MTIGALLAVAGGGVVSWWGTGRLRRYAVAHDLLDRPNDRSSHTVATPRGGGVGLVGATVAVSALGAANGWLDWPLMLAMLSGGGAVAVVGWLDDRYGLPPVGRLAVHLGAACTAVGLLGPVTRLEVGAESWFLGSLGWPLSVLAIAWMINAYNFMDGIDGIAGSGAVVGAGLSALFFITHGGGSLAFLAATVAASTAGFLVWNWAPAKIFLGDVGSGFLGFAVALIGLAANQRGAVPAILWGLLFGVFLFDATVTLVRRLLRHDRVYEAHRSHAYQRAVQSGLTHARVTSITVAADVALAMLVWTALEWPRLAVECLVAGVLLLAILYGLVEHRLPMGASAKGR